MCNISCWVLILLKHHNEFHLSSIKSFSNESEYVVTNSRLQHESFNKIRYTQIKWPEVTCQHHIVVTFHSRLQYCQLHHYIAGAITAKAVQHIYRRKQIPNLCTTRHSYPFTRDLGILMILSNRLITIMITGFHWTITATRPHTSPNHLYTLAVDSVRPLPAVDSNWGFARFVKTYCVATTVLPCQKRPLRKDLRNGQK